MSRVTVQGPMRVEPLACSLGAELSNLNLGDAAHDDGLFTEIKALLLRHKVLFLREGKRVDAVAQLTKTGFVYVFERETGRELFPIVERPVPASDVPGERASPTQPIPLAPPTLLIAAAGNESRRGDNPDFEVAVAPPAVAEGMVSVAALAAGAQGFSVAPFSNVGALVAGPGVSVTSAKRGGGLTAMSGTSMATPVVSGAAALLLARHRELVGQPRRVKDILCRTATDLGREPRFQGSGMVDVLRALQSI